jgi:DNA-binding CsgD family transcriptional regulator
MVEGNQLIGRHGGRAALEQATARVVAGAGETVLLGGTAGVGKTTLARSVLSAAGLDRVEAFGDRGPTMPYAPIVEALRGLVLARPAAAQRVRALSATLGTLLPELGTDVMAADDASMLDAIRSVLVAAAADRPLALLLDDMQWADGPTLAMLPGLARALADEAILLLVVYRDDELPSSHPVRRLRSELRRDQRLREVRLTPLDPAATAMLLADVLGAVPAQSLCDSIAALTGGVPFFVAEIATTLAATGRLQDGPAGRELTGGDELPVPESVRDAVLLRAVGLSAHARGLLDVATVFGQPFEVTAAMAVAGAVRWPDELLDRGVLAEPRPGQMAFTHPLVREVFYAEVEWARRADLHRRVARRLQDDGAGARVLAEHWLSAREPEQARLCFLDAIDDCCAGYAYRDGVDVARRALELTADGDEPARLEALTRLATCAELAGEPGESARAWREIAECCDGADPPRCAEAWRRCAASLEIQARWDEALASREAAAVAFAEAGARADAAAERLSAATHLRSAASFRASLAMLDLAGGDARAAQRPDLVVRIEALNGNVRARMGDGEAGVEVVRRALTTALDLNLSDAAAEIYQRLADSLEHRGDYSAARATYDDAAAFCNANGAEPAAQLCLACLAVVLRQAGEWQRALTMARQVMDSPASIPHARAAAACTLGVIHALRGDLEQARPLLLDAGSLGRQIKLTAAELQSAWGLAIVNQACGSRVSAIESCHGILARWQQTEERHYAIPPLRWATTLLAQEKDPAGARACAAALAQIAAEAGTPEAMSALGHALGEIAIVDDDPTQAVIHFERAIALLDEVGAPFERLESERRAGAALLLAGRREESVERLLTAYRLARRLRLRPSIQQLAVGLADLGERVDRRLSRLQAEQLGHEQLTRRELEVVQLLAAGATNREIAGQLFLSVRTVDMHVRNILRKLACRSRADATRRAGELGLLAAPR